jgi:hypothetical protein
MYCQAPFIHPANIIECLLYSEIKKEIHGAGHVAQWKSACITWEVYRFDPQYHKYVCVDVPFSYYTSYALV